jgi:hypothetical protein
MMRITNVIFVGSLAALVATAAPALAKNSQIPKPDEPQATPVSPCRAYQQAADGSWTELPCQGQGAAQGASVQTRQKSVSSGTDEPER